MMAPIKNEVLQFPALSHHLPEAGPINSRFASAGEVRGFHPRAFIWRPVLISGFPRAHGFKAQRGFP
jgi:hypothetical protein